MVGIEKPKEVPHGLETGNKLHVSILMLIAQGKGVLL